MQIMSLERGDSIRVIHPLFPGEDDGALPISPLQLQISEIDARKAQELNALWHSVLPETYLGNIVGHKHSVCFAACYKNWYYAVAIWTDPIAGNRMKDGDTTLELRRLAISEEAPKFTATRMIKVMRLLIKKKWPELTRLISYQSIQHHDGTIYKASGWTKTVETKFKEWKSKGKGRSRREQQIGSDKARWECCL